MQGGVSGLLTVLVTVIEKDACLPGLTVTHCWRGLTAIPARASVEDIRRIDKRRAAAVQRVTFEFRFIFTPLTKRLGYDKAGF